MSEFPLSEVFGILDWLIVFIYIYKIYKIKYKFASFKKSLLYKKADLMYRFNVIKIEPAFIRNVPTVATGDLSSIKCTSDLIICLIVAG